MTSRTFRRTLTKFLTAATYEEWNNYEVNYPVWGALCVRPTFHLSETTGLFSSETFRRQHTDTLSIAWNVAVVNSVVLLLYVFISASAGGAVEHGASLKYSSLPTTIVHILQPLTLETLGPINSTSISCLSELGRRLTGVSRDLRETETTRLFQRVAVSLAVQRYNSVIFSRTFWSWLSWTSVTSNSVFNFRL